MTCGHWVEPKRQCGATPTRRYMEGHRCHKHSPAVIAGREEA